MTEGARVVPDGCAAGDASAGTPGASGIGRDRGCGERGDLAAYGAPGLPLAFAALPTYVPRLYAEGLGSRSRLWARSCSPRASWMR